MGRLTVNGELLKAGDLVRKSCGKQGVVVLDDGTQDNPYKVYIGDDTDWYSGEELHLVAAAKHDPLEDAPKFKIGDKVKDDDGNLRIVHSDRDLDLEYRCAEIGYNDTSWFKESELTLVARASYVEV